MFFILITLLIFIYSLNHIFIITFFHTYRINMEKSSCQTTLSTYASSCDEEVEKCVFAKDLDFAFPSKVVQAITRVINKNEIRNSYHKIMQKQFKYIFSSSEIPSISLRDYLIRIIQMSGIEESIVVIALIYLDRICKNKIALIQYNIHRLLFTAILIAVKYTQDNHFSNKGFTYIAGIFLEDMNLMEYKFLKLIRYDLFISGDVLLKYHNYLSDISIEENK